MRTFKLTAMYTAANAVMADFIDGNDILKQLLIIIECSLISTVNFIIRIATYK